MATSVLCVFLLVLLAFGQAAHIHSNGADADHCPLCIVLHATPTLALAAAAIVLVTIARPVPIQEVRPVFRHWHPTLFTRPPPPSC